ncbi:MAG: hypothetical protein JWN17_76 [Frankiales bacterium]|nr:hypothetical protein [Frankiales bacterium]
MEPMTIITVSAPYGAGGSVVAPALAQRLGVPFLDRAISATVAAELDVSVEEAESGALHRGWLERMAFSMVPLTGDVGVTIPPLADEQELRQTTEQVLREASRGGAVVLGRAGAWALAGQPGVLRVRLYGPEDRRLVQAQRVEGVDAKTARTRMRQVDEARADYVRRLYGASVDAPDAYDLQVDSTTLPLDVVTEVIATAASGVS